MKADSKTIAEAIEIDSLVENYMRLSRIGIRIIPPAIPPTADSAKSNINRTSAIISDVSTGKTSL